MSSPKPPSASQSSQRKLASACGEAPSFSARRHPNFHRGVLVAEKLTAEEVKVRKKAELEVSEARRAQIADTLRSLAEFQKAEATRVLRYLETLPGAAAN